MRASESEFRKRFNEGRRHEAELILLLRRREFHCCPTGDIEHGKQGPRLLGPRGTAIVLPDVEAYRNAQCYPFELKSKSTFSWTRTTQRWETGFGLRLYREYLRYEQTTGRGVIIVMREARTGEFLARRLCHLDPRIYEGDKMDPGGMVFFPREQFFTFHQGPPADLPLFANVPVLPTRPAFDEGGAE